MSILSKLPGTLSTLALANSVAMPFVLKKKAQPAIQPVKQETTVVVTKVERPKAKMPKDRTQRWTQVNKFLECVGDNPEKKEECREKFYYWGEI